jgi:tetratricopeptide (TPR) repeat protein
MARHLHLVGKTFIALFFASALIFTGIAQAQETGLSKEALQSFNAGMDAAKKENWSEAIKQFSQAQKLAPTSPQVLFDLALAYDRGGDKELPALALYEAYLIAAPDAANSQTVHARIKELGTQIETNIRGLITYAQKTAAAIPDDVFTYGSPDVNLEVKLPYFKNVYNYIANAQINLGDFPGARATLVKVRELADSIKSLKSQDSSDYATIAYVQVWAKDFEGAMKTASSISIKEKVDDFHRSSAYCAILGAQLEQGDIAVAEKTDKFITNDFFKDIAKRYFADAKLKAGDIPAAESLASGIQDDRVRANTYLDIAKSQIEKKDNTQALESLNKALEAAGFIKDSQTQSALYLYYYIAEAQLKAGDTGAALKILADADKLFEKFPDQSRLRYWGYWLGVEIAANSKDIKKAKEMLAQAKDGLNKLKFPYINDEAFYAYGNIARIQNKIGDAEGSRKTIEEVPKKVLEAKRSDGGESAFLSLGRGWGDMKSAKVIYLVNFASSFSIGFSSNSPLLSEWPGWQKFMQSQKENKKSEDTVEKIAEAAQYLSEALKRIRAASIPDA